MLNRVFAPLLLAFAAWGLFVAESLAPEGLAEGMSVVACGHGEEEKEGL